MVRGILPKILTNDTMVTKLMNEWTEKKSKKSSWISKGLYTIIRAIITNQYHQSRACRTLEEACDILDVMLKRTFVIKRSRLIHLN